MKRTPLAAVAALLAVSVAAVGCGEDDPEPTFAPTEESSATASPSPSVSTSPTPRKLSPEETVRAWVEARNLALVTGEAKDLSKLSSENCESCQDQIDPILEVHEAGGEFQTDGWSIESLKVQDRSAKTATVATAVIIAGGTTVPEQGADPVKYGEEKRITVFELERENGAWRVSLVGFVR